MKKIKTITLFIGFILFFTCCESTNRNDTIVIDPNEFVDENILLSEYVDELVYITLSENVLFNRVSQAEFSDAFIFISTAQGVFKYDYSGNLVTNIGSIGPGPMEYVSCNNFAIDDDNKQVYIRDGQSIKIYNYSGQYIRTIQLTGIDGGIINLVYQDQKLYLISLLVASPAKTENYWYVMNTDGNIIDAKKNYDVYFEGNGMTLMGSFVYQTADYMGYWNQYSDTIFHVYNKEVLPAFIWSKGAYRLTPEKMTANDYQSSLRSRTILETNNMLYILYYKSDKPSICTYNKKGEKFSNMTINESKDLGFINDVDYGIPLNPTQVATVNNDEYLVQIVYPTALLELAENNRANRITGNLQTTLNNLTEDSNQVIIMARIKK